MPESNLESRHLMSVNGVPRTVQILHLIAMIGFFLPGTLAAPALFIVPVLLLLSQIHVTWQDVLFFVLAALGIGALFIVYTEMQQVIDAYRVLGNIRSELEAKDRNTLTIAECNVLACYRYGVTSRTERALGRRRYKTPERSGVKAAVVIREARPRNRVAYYAQYAKRAKMRPCTLLM